ncbi:MAG TPA: hypothetical protein VHX38_17370 [Pseudonocardiaceae bacterium]|nr:hypothetical protein [Pseudonocardiaceae bacterium]
MFLSALSKVTVGVSDGSLLDRRQLLGTDDHPVYLLELTEQDFAGTS